MRSPVTLLRIILTVAILGALLAFITPARVLADLQHCDWRWATLALLLAPVFLWCRICKWSLLERQVLGPADVAQVLPRYLWGMAVGLVTPGRVGELARMRAPTLSARGGGLFFLEKAVEVACLLSLCLLALPALGVLPWWTVLPLAGLLGYVFWSWRGVIKVCLTFVGRVTGRPSPVRRRELTDSLPNLRLSGCAVLSMACFLIYITQAYLVLRALGVSADPGVVLLYPLVLLANLVPITVGGYGVRETLAMVVLQVREIPAAKAAASVAIVTFFDLVLPGLTGAVLRGLGKVPSSNTREPSTPGSTPVQPDQWDDFWEARNRRWAGRLVAWVRQRFVTAKLAAYIRENTEKGTLVEAGCGSGEITLRVAAERGDDVVLVDCSPKALALAGRLARSYGIEARLVECDVAELGAHVRPSPDTTVFNVGVVEHFPDPSGVLREMAHVSGRDALAVIPERSAFWLVFIRIARLLGLVPRGFFVQFFDRKRLAAIVSEANLHVRWMRSVRILGVIPYLGVSYSLVPRREPRHRADVQQTQAGAQLGDSRVEENPAVEVTS